MQQEIGNNVRQHAEIQRLQAEVADRGRQIASLQYDRNHYRKLEQILWALAREVEAHLTEHRHRPRVVEKLKDLLRQAEDY